MLETKQYMKILTCPNAPLPTVARIFKKKEVTDRYTIGVHKLE